MVKSIQELYDKLEKREKKRLEAGEGRNGAHVLLFNKFRDINSQSSYEYTNYILSQKEFCTGFLYGMFSSHYITEVEFKILRDELASAYIAYLDRAFTVTKESTEPEMEATL